VLLVEGVADLPALHAGDDLALDPPPQAVHQAQDERLAGGRVQEDVEAPVELRPGVRLADRLHALHQLLGRVEVCRIECRDGLAQEVGLEQAAHLHDLVHVLRRQRRDDRAPVGPVLDEPFPLQPVQRLAQRVATDAQRATQPDLPQRLPRDELAGEDHLAHSVRGLPREIASPRS
jgi:hypothetical protein